MYFFLTIIGLRLELFKNVINVQVIIYLIQETGNYLTMIGKINYKVCKFLSITIIYS